MAAIAGRPFRVDGRDRDDGGMQADPGAPAPLRVVVVDADDRVRESLSRLLCIGDRLRVVGMAGEPDPALDVVRATRPDVVVVDPRLPAVDNGLSFLRRLRRAAPEVRVLVMSGTDLPEMDELTPLADGVVRKTYRATELLTAILGATVILPLLSLS
jgi:DNA-binding NarL/FixJ family response regulator